MTEFEDYERQQAYKREDIDDLPKMLRNAKGVYGIAKLLMLKEARLSNKKEKDKEAKHIELELKIQEVINGTAKYS